MAMRVSFDWNSYHPAGAVLIGVKVSVGMRVVVAVGVAVMVGVALGVDVPSGRRVGEAVHVGGNVPRGSSVADGFSTKTVAVGSGVMRNNPSATSGLVMAVAVKIATPAAMMARIVAMK